MQLVILSGYLGAGKTTWLRHHLRHQLRHHLRHGAAPDDEPAGMALHTVRPVPPPKPPPRPPHVIVNEAAPLPVDNLLLAGAGGLSVLAGGCACCTGQAALVAVLRGLADARSRGTGPARIILETSGLADPGAILAAVRNDPVLVSHVAIAETLVLIDAAHGAAQLAADPLWQRQIEVADRLILTRAATVDRRTLGVLLATLRQLSPAATIEAAELGVPVPLPDLPFGMPAPDPLPLPPRSAGRPAITATTLRVPADADWPALSLWLSALLHARGDSLIRVKGVIRTPAGRALIQSVRRVVQNPEILPDDETPPTTSPDAAYPDATNPNATNPNAAYPDAANPDAARADAHATEAGFLVFLGHGASADLLARSLHRFVVA